uniref:Nuclear autoantigenic sperm protein (histone-binding) n=1 Tax=Poecilia reticulata TaxID=8081 RepID=A0A3P9QCF5_POERE
MKPLYVHVFPPRSSGDVMEEAKKLIGTGKRHLVMGDVVSAVNVFQEACSMLAAKYGDTADECGEAFFLCGKSLLELARMENGVLGNALEGVPEESEEEEQPKNPNLESADNIDEDEGIEESSAEAEQTDETSEGSSCLETYSCILKRFQEEEDVGNLQLAWEMLEVAKVIFKRQESKDDQLMAAQAYLKLGEVSAETGNYPQALEDFQECLTLQLKLLPPHCRLLAETHYHVATTLVSMDQYNQAIQHYNSSVKVIETRLGMNTEEKNELEELKQLLPEIREKVEDAKESQRTASAASQAIQQTLVSKLINPIGCFPSIAAVFRSFRSPFVSVQRKPEEESPVKDTDAKQLKQEATVNGSGDSSASNGSETQEGKSKEASDRPVLPRLLNSGKQNTGCTTKDLSFFVSLREPVTFTLKQTLLQICFSFI